MNALATETYIVERNLNIFKENVGSKYFRGIKNGMKNALHLI